MKTFFAFILGAVLGALLGALTVMIVNDRRNAPAPAAPASQAPAPPPPATEPRSLLDKTKSAIDEKRAEWRLTTPELKEDLAKGGAIVREKAHVAGEKIADARILTVVKAKYVLDRELSARAIEVDVADGVVTLSGTVGSPELVGRAIALALESEGVVRVVSNLTVRPL